MMGHWEDAPNSVAKYWLGGPFPFDEGGKRVTALGPQLVDAAFSSGDQQGEKLRAVDDLKISQTRRAAAVNAPANLPTWGHFSAIFRPFQVVVATECLAMAMVDHKDIRAAASVRWTQ